MSSFEHSTFAISLIEQTGYWNKNERNRTNRERYNHGTTKQGKINRVKAPHKLTVNNIY